MTIQLTKADRFYTFVALGLEIPVEVFLILNVLGLFALYAGAFYLTFVFVVLLQLALSFGMLVHSLLLQQQGVDESTKSN
jgi:NhaP-type Na+/H+ or K+/H+ antiporter